MKKLTTLLAFLIANCLHLAAQTPAAMEAKLNNPATPKSERLSLSFSLAEKLMRTEPKKAADFAHRAAMLASELGDQNREVAAYLMAGEANYRRRESREANSKFNRAFVLAKDYGQTSQAIEALKQMETIATQKNDYREAFRLSQEGVALLQKNGGGSTSSGSDGYRSRLEKQNDDLLRENKALRTELSKVTGRTELLETNYQEALKETMEKSETQLGKKDEQIEKVSQEKMQVDLVVEEKERMLESMTKEQLADKFQLAESEKNVEKERARAATAELEQKKSDNFRNVLALVAAFILMLAVLLYFRYLAKKRTVGQLADQNAVIELEKKRSDELLLNILPAAIAQELRTNNKVKPQFYEQATVMFIDFKGFTSVSERLSPEMLVEEIDYCFSNFDKIIGQFKIEKIKTIGDAYMCASGLTDHNSSPTDMVLAGLEIQDFLQHLRAERMARGLPFFEARVGIHTGPVVAGVVGTKKFAYDIWGDTVNIAARMEENCDPGKVNVSESAYWLSKYEFEWVHRGKISAKNKGLVDMYYVAAIK